jgi:putative salt-induced outer membrane protein YdiY
MATEKHPTADMVTKVSASVRARIPGGRKFFPGLLFGLLLVFAGPGRAETVVLHLRNGDRISGEVISEDSRQTVLATAWSGSLSVPAAQIVSRSQPSSPIVAELTGAATNPPPAAPRRWKAEAQVGLNFAYGIQRRQIYYGKFKFDYKRPYEGDPQQSFRTTVDESVEYGKTDDVRSDNRMDGGVNMEFDFSPRLFVYNIARSGYDQIRKIDLQYEVGPGLGWHLIQRSGLACNLGVGADYQERHLADGTDSQVVFVRAGEDLHWQINHRFALEQKLEYFTSPAQSRARFEASLKYFLLQNLALNFTVQDLYDTRPAANVDQNELRFRSSLGVTF